VDDATLQKWTMNIEQGRAPLLDKTAPAESAPAPAPEKISEQELVEA
jgi:hypothetical protein